MKKTLIPTVCCLLTTVYCLFFISGCHESAQKTVKTAVESDSNFPQIMVGVWELDVNDNTGSKWAFKIEPDGSIPKLIHPIAGQINVKEGGYDIEGPDPGTYAAFIMGQCTSSYDAATGIFTVHIILDSFTMKLPQGELSGTSDDYFKGKVSEDGKVWKADWFSYSSLEGGSPLDVNDINANPEILTFRKVELNKELDKHKHGQ
ncbi:MAG: hypothetical protein WC770_10055 [Phycisphaerae bacterium]